MSINNRIYFWWESLIHVAIVLLDPNYIKKKNADMGNAKWIVVRCLSTSWSIIHRFFLYLIFFKCYEIHYYFLKLDETLFSGVWREMCRYVKLSSKAFSSKVCIKTLRKQRK